MCECAYLPVDLLFQIAIIRVAKEKGLPITCEVCPHHLFLCEEDIPHIGKGRAEVRPVLCSKEDQEALWKNLDIIDCFATDHGKTQMALAPLPLLSPSPCLPPPLYQFSLDFSSCSPQLLTPLKRKTQRTLLLASPVLRRCCLFC